MINKFQDVSVNQTFLDNGVRIISETVPGSRSFALGISVDVGSRDDIPGKAGLSHFVEHAVFRHSKKYSSKRISLEFENIGAYVNAFTTKEFICFYVRALNENFDKVFKLLSEVVFNPLFREKDTEKEKKIILEEIKSYDDDPEELIFDVSENILFNGNPMEYPIVGIENTVNSINSDDLRTFHSDYFIPSTTLIAFSGDIPIQKLVNSSTRNLNHLDEKQNNRKIIEPSAATDQKIQRKKDSQQYHIALSKRVPGMKKSSRYSLAALNVILGDGMSSRLYQALREKSGLVYSAYSSLQLYSDCGNIIIYAGSEKRNYKKIRNLIYDELEKLRTKKISKSELDRAKLQLKSSTLMALESLSNRMQAIVKSEFTFGRYEFIAETLNDIDNITIENVNDTIISQLNPENWNDVVFIPNN